MVLVYTSTWVKRQQKEIVFQRYKRITFYTYFHLFYLVVLNTLQFRLGLG